MPFVAIALLMSCFAILNPVFVEGFYELPIKNRSAVVTFDQLPSKDSACLSAVEKRKRILEALKAEKIEAAFFVVGQELLHSSNGFLTLEKVSEAGHRIGNNSYSLPHLSELDGSRYLADIEMCQALIKTVSQDRTWFRYPHFDVGLEGAGSWEAKVKRTKEVAQALIDKGYFHAYVSVDSQDAYLNTLLLNAIAEGHAIDQRRLELFYVEHLKRIIPTYTDLRNRAGQAAPFVFLFHANADITALCLPKVIAMLREEGWDFIPPEDAYDGIKCPQAGFGSIVLEVNALSAPYEKAKKDGTLQVFDQMRALDTKAIAEQFEEIVLNYSPEPTPVPTEESPSLIVPRKKR